MSTWLPFIALTVIAVALSLGLRRLVGPDRLRPARPAVRIAGVTLIVVAVTINTFGR